MLAEPSSTLVPEAFVRWELGRLLEQSLETVLVLE
jgi:hypothetical protein